MVIVVMGEDESARNRCGRFLAENLGWEFVESKCLDCLPLEKDVLTINDGTSTINALSAVIDSSIYEWRDTVVSCPILAEKDQRQIRRRSQQVEFVRLKTSLPEQRLVPSCEADGAVSFVIQPGQNVPRAYDDTVLTIRAAENMEQFCSIIVSELVLKQSRVRG